jgi:sugar-specific transcriptional regulator TrmB
LQNFSGLEIQEVEVFTGLGLTINQAKIYLALTKLGISTAKQISNASNVTREEVYRNYSQLIDLGLIEKIITSPIRLKAVPLEQGVAVLTQLRTRKEKEIQRKAREIVATARKTGKKRLRADLKKNHSAFSMIPNRLALVTRIKEALGRAQEAVSIITSMKRHPRAIYVYNEALKKAFSKGVKFRIAVGELEEEPPEIAQKFGRNPLVSVKYISSAPKAVMVLIDNAKGFLMTSPTAELEDSPALQIENPSLIGVLQDYFECIWSKKD